MDEDADTFNINFAKFITALIDKCDFVKITQGKDLLGGPTIEIAISKTVNKQHYHGRHTLTPRMVSDMPDPETIARAACELLGKSD